MSKDNLNVPGCAEHGKPQGHAADHFGQYKQVIRKTAMKTLNGKHPTAKIDLIGQATLPNDLDTPTGQREQHGFAELVTQLGRQGYLLVKTDPKVDGQPPYWVFSQGVAQEMESLDEVRTRMCAMPVEDPGNG